MTSTPSELTGKWIADAKVDKEKLRQLAIQLEQQLRKDSPLSKDIASFAEYPPLVSAIQRAKDMQIDDPEELPGIRYWYFESGFGDVKSSKLGEILAMFQFALRAWRFEQAQPGQAKHARIG
jgi:hypothetical protein